MSHYPVYPFRNYHRVSLVSAGYYLIILNANIVLGNTRNSCTYFYDTLNSPLSIYRVAGMKERVGHGRVSVAIVSAYCTNQYIFLTYVHFVAFRKNRVDNTGHLIRSLRFIIGRHQASLWTQYWRLPMSKAADQLVIEYDFLPASNSRALDIMKYIE